MIAFTIVTMEILLVVLATLVECENNELTIENVGQSNI